MKNYTPKQLRILIGSLLLMVTFGSLSYSTGYFVAPVTEALGIPRSLFTMYVMIMNLVGVAVTPFAGRLLPQKPIRKIVLVNAIAGGLFVAGFSLAQNIYLIYILAALIGLIRDISTLLLVTYVINRAFGDKSGAPIGIAMSGTAVCGMILGLFIPRYLNAFGWRSGYLCLGVFWLVIQLIVFFLFHDIDREETPVTAPGAKSAALSNDDVREIPGVSFHDAIRGIRFYLLLLAVFFINVCGIFFQQLPAHFVRQGVTETMAGLIMSLFSFATIVLKITQGYLYDRIGAVKSILLIHVVFAFGFLLALSTSVPVLYVSAVLLAIGMASLTIMPPLLTRTVFGMKEYTAIYSFVSMSFTLGNAVGNPVWGLVYDASGSYAPGVMASPFIVLLTMAVFIFILRGKKAKAESAA